MFAVYSPAHLSIVLHVSFSRSIVRPACCYFRSVRLMSALQHYTFMSAAYACIAYSYCKQSGSYVYKHEMGLNLWVAICIVIKA